MGPPPERTGSPPRRGSVPLVDLVIHENPRDCPATAGVDSLTLLPPLITMVNPTIGAPLRPPSIGNIP